MEEWIFAHLGVIEASVNRLQSSLDLAYMHRRTFVSATHQAVMQLEQVCFVICFTDIAI